MRLSLFRKGARSCALPTPGFRGARRSVGSSNDRRSLPTQHRTFSVLSINQKDDSLFRGGPRPPYPLDTFHTPWSSSFYQPQPQRHARFSALPGVSSVDREEDTIPPLPPKESMRDRLERETRDFLDYNPLATSTSSASTVNDKNNASSTSHYYTAKSLIHQWQLAFFHSSNKNQNGDEYLCSIIERSQQVLDHANYLLSQEAQLPSPVILKTLSLLHNRILSMHADNDDVPRAIKYLHTVNDHNSYYPCSNCYHTVLNMCAERRLSIEAEDILLHMLKRASLDTDVVAAQPTTTTFNIVLKAQRDPQRAFQILERMLSLYKNDGYANIQPDLISFHTVMSLYAKQPNASHYHHNDKRSDNVKQVIKVMETQMMDHDNNNNKDKNNQEYNDTSPNGRTYNILLLSHTNDGDLDLAEDLLTKLRKGGRGGQADAYSYTTLINAFVKQGDVVKAEEILEQMVKEDKVAPTTVTYNTVISGWCNKEDPERGEKLLRRMRSTSSPPDLATYSVLIDKYSLQKKASRAHKLLDELENSNDKVGPDSFCYNSVVSAYAAQGDGERAHSILRRMESARSEIVSADTISYNVVLSAYNKGKLRNAPFKARTLLSDMERGRNPAAAPDIISYTTLLSCWAGSNHPHRLREMRSVLDRVEQREGDGFRVDADPYNVFLKACADHFATSPADRTAVAKTAFDTLRRMEQRTHGRPDVLTYNSVLLILVKHGFVDRAHELLLDMADGDKNNNDTGILPDVVSYNTVLHGHARTGEAERAEDLLQRMCRQCVGDDDDKSKAVRPNTLSFNSVIAALAKKGDAVKAASMLSIMKGEASFDNNNDLVRVIGLDPHNSNIKPDKFTYTTVLHAWIKSGSPHSLSKALELVNDMMTGDDTLTPDTVSFNTLIHAVARSKERAKARMAVDVLQQSVSIGARPDIVTLNTVLNACNFTTHPDEKAGAFRIASRLFDEMTGGESNSNGRGGSDRILPVDVIVRPDDITFGTMMKVCRDLLHKKSNSDKQAYIEAVFRKACDGGQVSEFVLKSLRYAARDEKMVRSIIGHCDRRTTANNIDRVVELEDLPQEWRRHVRRRTHGGKVYR